MLSWAKAEWAEIDSLRWSTTTKQLSGLHWQNEYWRRPISAGTGPSMEYHSQTGDWTLRLSLLNWFITKSVKKDPNWRKSTLHRQAIHLSLITTLQNKLLRCMGEWIQNGTTSTYSFSVTEKTYSEEYEQNYREDTPAAFKSMVKEVRSPPPWLCLASKGNQKWKPIQMGLNFSLSCMLAHTHIAGRSHRLVTCRHDWKYRLCGKSEIASVGLMNSGQNHFRQPQQRINTVIVINGNKIGFSPEIIIAFAHLLRPVPTSPNLCFFCYSCSLSLFPLPPIVCTPPSLTPFSFL